MSAKTEFTAKQTEFIALLADFVLATGMLSGRVAKRDLWRGNSCHLSSVS
jgi:hypothetical protein